MKTAVVYYSFKGNSALVAAQLAEKFNADVVRIELKDDRKRRSFFKYLWGGWMVISKKLPELKPLNFDSSKYDFIILGAPVWASNPAPPLLSFISKAGITGKKVALYACFGGDEGKFFKVLRPLLANNKIAGETGFKMPVSCSFEEIKQKIDEWVKSLNI